jgi:hypothetical protein
VYSKLRKNLHSRLHELSSKGDPLGDRLALAIVQFDDIEKSFARLNAVLAVLKKLETNESLLLSNEIPELDANTFHCLQDFLKKASAWPSNFDERQIKKTEQLFKEQGYLSSLVFLFASLPEVYIMPDISSILHVTGQLKKIAEQRIRSTATMVLAVLLEGGLLSPRGVGIVLTLRARIIHSFIRVLLLRDNPENLKPPYSSIPRLKNQKNPRHLFEMVYQNGWEFKDSNLPCNQLELLYTLLTFSFIYLRSLKRLNLDISADDQEAYLAIWNIVGHFMGIDVDFFPQNYKEAEILFNEIHFHGYKDKRHVNFQKNLIHALLESIENNIPKPYLRPFVRLFARYLTSAQSNSSLQLITLGQIPIYALFFVSLKGLILFDQLLNFVFPNLQLMKSLCRKVSLSIIQNMLLSEEQAINLPVSQKLQVESLLNSWNKHNNTPIFSRSN